MRLAMLRGGQHLHKLKWHPGAIGGNYEARCGLRAWRDEYWEFDPPEGVKSCGACKSEKDPKAKEWDEY